MRLNDTKVALKSKILLYNFLKLHTSLRGMKITTNKNICFLFLSALFVINYLKNHFTMIYLAFGNND